MKKENIAYYIYEVREKRRNEMEKKGRQRKTPIEKTEAILSTGIVTVTVIRFKIEWG